MIYEYIAVALLIIVLLVLLLSYIIAKSIFKPRTFGYDHTKEIETEKNFYNEDYLSSFEVSEIYEESDSLKLHAHYIDNNSTKTMIIMHGHTYTLFGSYKYAKIFLDRGYNVLLPDQRYHGHSEGKNCTLGYLEKDDLHMWIDFIKKENPLNEVIGLHGESMGAATVLLGGDHQDVNFIIEDCSFSDLKTETAEILKKSVHLPKVFVYPTHLLSVLFFKAPLLKVNPGKNIENIKAPILFIHGKEDSYIKLSHFERLTESKKESDSTYICLGADHAQSFEKDSVKYTEVVNEFLDNLGYYKNTLD